MVQQVKVEDAPREKNNIQDKHWPSNMMPALGDKREMITALQHMTEHLIKFTGGRIYGGTGLEKAKGLR